MPATFETLYRTTEYTDRNPTYHVEDSPWKASHVLRILTAHGLRPRSVAEVGCGAGEILRQLQAKMPDDTVFDGFEISPPAFDLCRARANERLSFHCEDLLALPHHFDLCLCMDVIEHVPDYIGFIKGLRGKAEYKIFHIPLDLSALSVLRGWPVLEARKSVGHIQYFFKDTALASLRDAGYEIIDWFYTSGAIDFPQTVKAKLIRWPRLMMLRLNRDLAVRLLGGCSMLVLAR